MKKITTAKLILITPLFILLSHYLAVFPHEYAHSTMAWLLGYKNNPLNIDYGGTSLINLLLLSHIDENVNYHMIFAAGHPMYVGLIAFAGPGIANGTLFIVSCMLLKRNYVTQFPYLFYFLFWFNLMNLGNFYDYVPIRTFAGYGDIHNLVTGFAISPWWVYIIVGYAVAFLIWQFFTKIMISAFFYMSITSVSGRACLMGICVFILFGFFGGFTHNYFSGTAKIGEVTYLFSATSFLVIPGILIVLWPTREWCKRQLEKLTKD